MASESPRRQQWRFTWEALAHIPTLRLYLFRPGTDPSAGCRRLAASLRLDRHLLLVSWLRAGGEQDEEDGEEEVFLRVPVPRVLIDPSIPVECSAKSDYIEIKLALVLPVDHPIVADLRRLLDSEGEESLRREGSVADSYLVLPLNLDSDKMKLSAGDAHFYCRTCSEKLTRQPLRRFVEMPSVNWREVADNWFGACCCSFGGISEKMVAQYIRSHHCAEGTGLLDSASVIICKDDLEVCLIQQSLGGHPEEKQVDSVASNNNLPDTVKGHCNNNLTEETLNVGFSLNSAASEILVSNIPGRLDSTLEEAFNFAQPSLGQALTNLDQNLQKLNLHCFGSFDEPSPEPPGGLSLGNHYHCCGDKTNSADAQESKKSLEPQENQKLIRNSSLGGGFLVRTANIFNDVEWVCFSCKNCSSQIGCYPSFKSLNMPVDNGIRLFKCHISTSTSIGGACNIFRKHTLQRVFVNLLVESAEDELSYRVIVRDLKSKSPRLQLVLLSSKAWWSNGYCTENVSVDSLPTSDLQPVLKVSFSECSFASEEDLRILKDWSTKKLADEVYMMPYLIEELTKCLKSASNKLPLSCSSMEGMSLSVLER